MLQLIEKLPKIEYFEACAVEEKSKKMSYTTVELQLSAKETE